MLRPAEGRPVGQVRHTAGHTAGHLAVRLAVVEDTVGHLGMVEDTVGHLEMVEDTVQVVPRIKLSVLLYHTTSRNCKSKLNNEAVS